MEDLKKVFDGKYYSYDYIYTYHTYKSFGKDHFYDFCILTDKETPDKKVIRFQKRFFGTTKSMREKGETKPRWILYDTFNLNIKKDFPPFIKVLEKFKQGKLDEVKDVALTIDFNAEVKRMVSLGKELKSISTKKRKSKEAIAELNKKQEKIKALSEEINKLNDENRKLKIQAFKSNISGYKKIIKDLQSKLDNEKDNENYFQQELVKNKWIFGPWYEDVQPKRKADAENQPDFILKRYDGYADVVEIEAPGKDLFTKPTKSNKQQPTEKLTQSFSQIMDYLDSYNSATTGQYYKDSMQGIENPLNPYKPRGIVIIGRDKKQERQKLRQYNSYLNHVTVITYDEFFKNAESMIDFIDKKKI
jgi:hypothetical protein